MAGGLSRIERFLTNGVERNKLSPDERDATLSRLSGTTQLDDLAGCDLVIEAIIEDLEAKKATLQELDPIVAPEAILASNTSSLCITELSAVTTRPDRFLGLHFFSPVPIMKIVEVIRGLATADATYRRAMDFVQTLGKDAVTAPDRPGFIVNRLLIPFLLSAVRAHEAGVGSIDDIDKGMALGCGHPMGPFTLLDFIGVDTTYSIANIMYEEFSGSRLRSTAALETDGARWPTGTKERARILRVLMTDQRLREAVEVLLAEIGEDSTREGLASTPERVAKALRFLTSGYDADVDSVDQQRAVHSGLQRDGDRSRHRLLQPVRASPAAVLREVPRRVSAPRQGCRAEQDTAKSSRCSADGSRCKSV